MTILDFGASELGGWWDDVPPSERPALPRAALRKTAVPRRAAPLIWSDADSSTRAKPGLIGWTLRIATVLTLLVATLLGLEIGMNAPTISPVAVVGQAPQPDGRS